MTEGVRQRPPLGVIEAFYGEPWGWDARAAAVDFLAARGFDFYIYAPKSDAGLRREWRDGPDGETLARLAGLAARCREAGLAFGIGLSPVGARRENADRAELRRAVARLDGLGRDLLCLLFDDMPADTPDLAAIQAACVDEISDAATSDRVLFCPTVYSFDPLVTADVPDWRGYLRDIGRRLDSAIDIFWTGPEVRSHACPANHLSEVAELIRRKPFLWDNHLANDGKASCDFLPLGTAQTRAGLANDLTAGCALNPMNQPELARLPLQAIATGDGLAQSCRAVCGVEVGTALATDAKLFQDTGRANLGARRRSQLAARYRRFPASLAARELTDWLDGRWPWDPECLTG